MAQFIPFDEKVEVNGQTILSFLNALPAFKEDMLNVLVQNNLQEVKPGEWYLQKNWLAAFRQIGEEFGSHTLFAIGKAIPENADFPPGIENLEQALSVIDVAYQMNHRNGEIGYYRLKEFHEPLRLAIMECKNPYPSNFDRGIITSMVRQFRPKDSLSSEIVLDLSLPSRQNGAESCTFKISW